MNYNKLECLVKYFTRSDGRITTFETLSSTLEETIKEHDENIPVVVSAEGLSGGYFDDNLSIPDKIQKTFPQAKIIICIRDQKTVIPSLYSVHIKNGGIEKYPEFVKKIVTNNKFDYFQLINKYYEVFGEQNILVLFYEDLKKQQQDFLKQLFDFIGLASEEDVAEKKPTSNRRSPVAEQKFGRIINKLLYKKNQNLANKVKSFSSRILNKLEEKKIISCVSFEEYPETMKLIGDHYHESNQNLFKLINKDNFYNVK